MHSSHAANQHAVEGGPRTIVNQRRRQLARAESGLASRRVVVACSIFVVLVGTTALVGARTTIGPLLQSAADARAAMRSGAVVYALPDGVYCRQVSFDNTTAEIKEGAMQRCRDNIERIHTTRTRDFAWGRGHHATQAGQADN
jgi:hypothetical protein